MSEKLRNFKMYQMQETFDNLYHNSKNGDNFYKLMEHIVSDNNIRLAYRSIKTNTGSTTPGCDKLTIRDIQKLSENELIDQIKQRIKHYTPRKVRQVMIPKQNGDMRPLGIPSIWDRLIQQCILQVLEPIMEAKFYRHSYGFRPNRSAHHALSRVVSLINRGKMYYAVNIDIKSFFDEIDHSKLKKQMWAMGIRDKALLAIINKILKAEVEGKGIPEKGTPQGGILSPILSNICLNELDYWVSSQWENIPIKTQNIHSFHNTKAKRTNLKSGYIVRYADDFKIMCRTYNHAVRFYHAVVDFLEKRLNLKINVDKSSIVNLKHRSMEFLGFDIKAVVKKSAKNGYVARTHICDSAKRRIKSDLTKNIKAIQMSSYNAKTSVRYNQLVMGIKNYYQYATHVYLDLDRIGMSIFKVIRIRLKGRGSYQQYQTMDVAYKKHNMGLKKHTKIMVIGGHTPLHVINAIKHKNPMNFQHKICLYTQEGRTTIAKETSSLPEQYVKYILDGMNYSYKGYRGAATNVEYLDNRLSKYMNQNGKCAVTKERIHPSMMQCHHIIPKKLEGDDSYHNLVWVSYGVHKLIHATDDMVIERLMSQNNITKPQLMKLNKLRESVGNIAIKQ